MKVWKKMTAAAGLLAALAMGFVACETFQTLLGGGTEGEQQKQEAAPDPAAQRQAAEEEEAAAQRELDAWKQEAVLIISQAEKLPDGKNKASGLQRTVEWPPLRKDFKDDRAYNEKLQAAKGELQALKDWVAETQKQMAAANAKGVTEADFTVDVTQDGKGVIITGYKGMATAVKLPAAIQGMPVRVIRGFGDSSITSVVIPEGVTTIDRQAFNNCEQLAQVTLPSTLKSIEEGAFSGTALKAVVIPRGVTAIDDMAFQNCTSLATVTIPGSVTEIGEGAFRSCTSLASVTIPNSVTAIGQGAFRSCTSLASITIPGSVTKIGKEYTDGGVFGGCTSLASVTIQNGVTEIGGDAFSGCTSLATVTIPDSVRRIWSTAFRDCTSLTTVTISPVQRNFPYGTWGQFSNCSKLSLASQGALRAAGYTDGF